MKRKQLFDDSTMMDSISPISPIRGACPRTDVVFAASGYSNPKNLSRNSKGGRCGFVDGSGEHPVEQLAHMVTDSLLTPPVAGRHERSGGRLFNA